MATYPTLNDVEAAAEAIIGAAEASFDVDRNETTLDAAYDLAARLVAAFKRKASDPETFTLDLEYTDTFGGEANYCWVNRESLELPQGISDRALVRRAKAALGLSGVRGRMDAHGDQWAFYPYGFATVAFFTVRY